METYEERVGEVLTVIGEAHRRHMVLVMAASGAVYGGYDDVLIQIGDDGGSALETLCEGRDTRPVD